MAWLLRPLPRFGLFGDGAPAGPADAAGLRWFARVLPGPASSATRPSPLNKVLFHPAIFLLKVANFSDGSDVTFVAACYGGMGYSGGRIRRGRGL